MPPGYPSNASHLFCVKGWGFIRFHPDNVHKSCIECNLLKEGNTVNYLKRLPLRIGQKATDELVALAEDQNARNNHKWQRWWLEEQIQFYKQKIKENEH